MTSLIDVVFLLLIFFITTSAFVRTERNLNSGIRVDRTASGSQVEFEPAVISIVSNQGRFVYRLGQREFENVQQLEEVLRMFPNKVDGAFLKVGPDAPFAMPAAAIQACKNANFPTVSYLPLASESTDP